MKLRPITAKRSAHELQFKSIPGAGEGDVFEQSYTPVGHVGIRSINYLEQTFAAELDGKVIARGSYDEVCDAVQAFYEHTMDGRRRWRELYSVCLAALAPSGLEPRLCAQRARALADESLAAESASFNGEVTP